MWERKCHDLVESNVPVSYWKAWNRPRMTSPKANENFIIVFVTVCSLPGEKSVMSTKLNTHFRPVLSSNTCATAPSLSGLTSAGTMGGKNAPLPHNIFLPKKVSGC